MKNPTLAGILRNIHDLTYVRRLFLFCCPIIYSYLCSRQIGGTASRPARIGGTASRRARMPGTASPVRLCGGTPHLLHKSEQLISYIEEKKQQES